MSSGFGYGEAKGRRRERSTSSRSGAAAARAAEKRPKGTKKEKKEKKHRDPDDPRRKKRVNRSRSRRREDGTPQPPQAGAAADEAPLGRTASRTSLPPGPAGAGSLEMKRGSWREEMTTTKEKDDDEGPIDGIIAMEDDEEVDRKLAESRARREALIAKWVNKGEREVSGPLEMPDTPMGMEESDDSSGDEQEGDRQEGRAGADEPQDEATQQLRRDLMRYIIDQKAEHDDDMFQENADEEALRKKQEGQTAAISQTGASADDWDDTDGYYKAKIGEVMLGRYLVVEDTCGKGVFSNVVKAKDQNSGEMVAIKVMRCNDMMKKAAEKEIEILERLNRADKGNKRHVIRLIKHYFYRGHMCLVFECMWDNLRVALKKYTKDKGMSLQAVRAYTKQLLIALRHIHRMNIVHADIKPDNILISAGHNIVKICDLGSAMELTECETTPYLVSRFYRAPEIVIGAKYGMPCDTFAMGCTLFELFTGKIMFPGKSNNDMLRLFMEWKGKLPKQMIKTGTLWKQHFTEDLDFKYQDKDKMTRKPMVRTLTDLSQKQTVVGAVMARVGKEKQQSAESDDILYCKKAKQFADLIDKMTAVDPEKRISPEDALKHAFLAEAGPGSAKTAKGAQNHKR